MHTNREHFSIRFQWHNHFKRSIISISKDSHQDECSRKSIFRDSESNWDEHREWIYWTNLVKKSNFESTGAPITLFSSPVAKPISMRSVYRFFLFESEQHVRCRRRRNVSGLRRCTFDLTESRRFFPHRRIYFSSLIRNISLTPFNLASFFLSSSVWRIERYIRSDFSF